MKNIAFVYPGQGSQTIQMGKDLYDAYSEVREIFELANENSELDIKTMCFEGSIEELTKTENTQPTILTVSHAITNLLKTNNIEPNYSLGLSLGEYAALVQSGKLEFADAIKIVSKRAQLMKSDALKVEGSMKVCLGLNFDEIQSIIDQNFSDQGIFIANINAPGQIVLTGLKNDLDAAESIFLENGVKRYLDIKVDGPFHSKYLANAAKQLEDEITKYQIHDFNNPVISNFTGLEFNNETFTKELAMQVQSPVKFLQSVEYLVNEKNVDTFIEIGPGKTASSLIKKITKEVKVYNVDNVASFEKLLEELNNKEVNNG